MGCPSGYTASPTPPLNNGVHTTLIRQKSGGGDITGPMARFAHISRPQCRIPSANSRRRRRQLVLARRSERRSRRFRRTFSSALDAGRSNQSKRRKRAELSPAEKDQATAQNTQSKRLNRADLSHTDTTTDNVPGDTVATATGAPRLIELQRKQYDPRCDGNEERQQEPQ